MKRSYSILLKPAGARCNLRCKYCYYIDKQSALKQTGAAVMSAAVLESFIRQYSEINTYERIDFVWQGGEPTLCGAGFFEEALRLQRKYCRGKLVQNILQTNAVCIDDELCKLLKENDFLVGVSIDGPKRLHDLYRVDPKGNGTHDRVMKAIELLKFYGVRFNTLTALNSQNSLEPLEVYGFLKSVGSEYMQFLPVVERLPSVYEQEMGFNFSKPPKYQNTQGKKLVSDISVTPELFADFYIAVFEEWRENDLGKRFIQLFEAVYGNLTGRPPGFCVHERVCGHAAALEYNGDVYSCDHFAYDEYRLGNIMSESLYGIMEKNRQFGISKSSLLPDKCVSCGVLDLCNGGCPKHRIGYLSGSCQPVNYLCEGYRSFFEHSKAFFNTLGGAL